MLTTPPEAGVDLLVVLVIGEPQELTSPWVVGAWEIPEEMVSMTEGISAQYENFHPRLITHLFLS